MNAFSVLTPYYEEEVIYSLKDLDTTNEDGITTLFYLQKVFPGWPQSLILSCFVFTEDYLLDSDSNCFSVNICLVFVDDWKHFKERFRKEDDSEESDKQFVDRMSGRDDVAEGGSQRKNDSKRSDVKKENPEKRLEDEPGFELCLWASYRGQTLARTVRGMMYYERSGLVPVLIFVSCVTCEFRVYSFCSSRIR
jgi:callose synthase